MSTELEEQLTESMRREVAGIALTGDVLGNATRRHRRRTNTMRAGVALGVAGLAGALAIGLTASTPPRPQAATPAPPAASVKLVSAAQASDNISYRLRLTTSGNDYEGAFDPRTDTGYVRSPQDDSVTTELLINGTRYMGGEPPLQPLPPDKGPGEKYGRYGQYPGKHDSLILYSNGDPLLAAIAPNPAGLLKVLKDAKVTENPDGSLHFEFTRQIVDRKTVIGTAAVSGDVSLDKDDRIAGVTITEKYRYQAKGKLHTGTSDMRLKLWDYGLKVKVQKPKDVVPAR